MEVVFDDPTDSSEFNMVDFPGFYTVIVRESFDQLTVTPVDSLRKVHTIIRKTKDYKFHHQKLSDPYTYIVITNQFYKDTHGESLFDYAF